MSACVAAHVALNAKRPIASLECALERCGITLSADEMMVADGKLETYDVRPCGCERGSGTAGRGLIFLF